MLSPTLQNYLDRDTILSGVFEWIIMASPLISTLSYKPMVGNSLKYNVELTEPTPAWIARNETLTENTGTFEQRTADAYTIIHTGYTNKSAIKRQGTQSAEAVDIEKAVKAIAYDFEKKLIIGQTSVASTVSQLKGLLKIIAEFESEATVDLDGINNSQVIVGNAATGALTTTMMDELLDQIKPGKADLILLSRLARRKMNALKRAAGSGVEDTDSVLFGRKTSHYDGVAVWPSDWLKDNYVEGSSSVQTIADYDYDAAKVAGTNENTMILAMQIGEDMVTALEVSEMEHERETFIEDQHAVANRFSWEIGLACFKKFSLAVLTGVNPSD